MLFMECWYIAMSTGQMPFKAPSNPPTNVILSLYRVQSKYCSADIFSEGRKFDHSLYTINCGCKQIILQAKMGLRSRLETF